MHLTHGQAGPGPRCSGRCRGRGKARGAHEPLPRLCAGPRHRINGEAVPLPHPRQGTPSPGTGNQARVPVDEDSAPYSVEDSGADDGGLAGPASLTGPRTRRRSRPGTRAGQAASETGLGPAAPHLATHPCRINAERVSLTEAPGRIVRDFPTALPLRQRTQHHPGCLQHAGRQARAADRK